MTKEELNKIWSDKLQEVKTARQLLMAGNKSSYKDLLQDHENAVYEFIQYLGNQPQPLPSVQGLVDALEKIKNIEEAEGVKGCTYGDTDFDSMSAAFGYNSARQYIQSIASEALSKFKSQESGIDGWVKANEKRPKEGWYHALYEGIECVLDTNEGTYIITFPNGGTVTNPNLDLLKYRAKP